MWEKKNNNYLTKYEDFGRQGEGKAKINCTCTIYAISDVDG